MKKFAVLRSDPDSDLVDDWDGVANEFDSAEEARAFVTAEAPKTPGIEYAVFELVTVGVAPLPSVTFTDA